MKPTLLRVWLRVTVLWWLVGAVTWATSNERISKTWLQLTGQHIPVNAFNAAHVALWVLRRWSLPVALIDTLLFAAGIAGAWATEVARKRSRVSRLKADPPWRDVKITIGELPLPDWVQDSLPQAEIEFDDDLAASLAQIPEAHRRLLNEVLTLIKMHPEVYVGDGHKPKMTLIDHTINVLSRLPAGKPDNLLPVLLAAHDIGKIRTQKKQEGSGGKSQETGKEAADASVNGAATAPAAKHDATPANKDQGTTGTSATGPALPHDDWSGLLLAGMPSFYDVPEADQRIAVLALRFGHKASLLPQLPDRKEQDRLVELLMAVKKYDGSATAQEKRETIAELPDKHGLLCTAFTDCLHRDLDWQEAGQDRGVQAGGWRKGNRIYLSEPRLRDALLRAIHRHNPHAAAAWDEDRARGKTADVTDELIEALTKNGWLLTEIDGRRASLKPLWIVKSGTVTLNGMLIVEPPSNALIGITDAPYAITVLDGQFGIDEVGLSSASSASLVTTESPKAVEAQALGSGTSPQPDRAQAPAKKAAPIKTAEPLAGGPADYLLNRPLCQLTEAERGQVCRMVALNHGLRLTDVESAAKSFAELTIEAAYDKTFGTSLSSTATEHPTDLGNAATTDGQAPAATGDLTTVMQSASEHTLSESDEQGLGDDCSGDAGLDESHDGEAPDEERYDNETVSTLAGRYGLSVEEVKEAAGNYQPGRTIGQAIEIFIEQRRRGAS